MSFDFFIFNYDNLISFIYLLWSLLYIGMLILLFSHLDLNLYIGEHTLILDVLVYARVSAYQRKKLTFKAYHCP